MFSDTPLPAGLGRRLAEAADGFRDDLYHYFIASRTYPYFLVIPPGSSSDDSAKNTALAELEKSRLQHPGRNYDVFGPFLTPADLPASDFDFIEIRMIRNDQYQSPTVVRSFNLPPDTDAIFLTLSAYDKFALPYYARLHPGEKTQQRREETRQYMAARAPAIHKSGTYQFAADGTPIDVDE